MENGLLKSAFIHSKNGKSLIKVPRRHRWQNRLNMSIKKRGERLAVVRVVNRARLAQRHGLVSRAMLFLEKSVDRWVWVFIFCSRLGETENFRLG
jgi:hypothetical protein